MEEFKKDDEVIILSNLRDTVKKQGWHKDVQSIIGCICTIEHLDKEEVTFEGLPYYCYKENVRKISKVKEGNLKIGDEVVVLPSLKSTLKGVGWSSIVSTYVGNVYTITSFRGLYIYLEGANLLFYKEEVAKIIK